MSPRLTDWSLALTVGLAFTTGLISLVSGRAEQWFIFAAHGVAGLWLWLITWGKLRRVWPRLAHPRAWDRRTVIGVVAGLFTTITGVTGVWWVHDGTLVVAGYNLLNWHIIFGFALTLFVSLHMFARARPLRPRDVRGRRQMLRRSGVLLGGIALWPLQQGLSRALELSGAQRRFTGSREIASYAGNAFPTVSWVADNPQPIDPAAWRLRIGGAVTQPISLGYADISGPGDELEATLDCTGGFYSTQIWRGACIDRILEQAQPEPDAHWVQFTSVTGYRWSLPLAEAREALLATHVGSETLSHGHGAPARLVAPGRRGFQWVKWVERIDVLKTLDYSDTAAIWTSSFTQRY
jgi:hypothetical protein